MEQIIAALRQLDPFNDNHWTVNGDPRIDAVKELAGHEVEIDRQAILDVAPDLTRETAASPESLIMNKAKESTEISQEPVLVEKPEETEDLYSSLLGLVSDVAEELVEKCFRNGIALNDQELLLVHEKLDADGLILLNKATLQLQTRHQQNSDRSLEQIRVLRRMEAITKNKINVVRPEKSNTDAIRDYLDSQNKTRLQKSVQRDAILRNLDPNSISPMSELDQAMARKNSRGKNRPKF